MFEEENTNTDERNLIIQAIQEKKFTTFLELCYVIHEMTEETINAKQVLETLNDEQLIRKIKKLEAITEDNENEIYYYEKDDYTNKTLQYNKEIEQQIRTIRNKQLKKLALKLKELNKEEDINLED